MRRACRRDDRVSLRFDYDPRLQDTLKKRLGARWDPDAREWWISIPRGRSARTANELLAGLGFRDVDTAVPCTPASTQRRTEEIRVPATIFVDEARRRNAPLEHETLLRSYQAEGATLLANARRSLLADQPGLGKSYQALAAVIANKALPLWIVCPAAVRTNWLREITAVAPWLSVSLVVSGDDAEARSDVTIVSWEGLSKHRRHLQMPQAVIADESHFAKDLSAQRTKALLATAAQLPADGMLLGLSGTPVVNGHADLLPTLEAIDALCLFGSRQQFLDRYCSPRTIKVPVRRGSSERRTITQYRGSKRAGELRSKLLAAGVLLRRRKSDVLHELPPKQIGVQVVDLDKSWQELIDAARVGARSTSHHSSGSSPTDQEAEDALTALAVDASLPSPKSVLRRQARRMPGDRSQITFMRRMTGVAKLPFATAWIEAWLAGSGDSKIVVFARHREVTTALAGHFEVDPLIGGISQRRRQAAIEQFTSDPDSRVVVASYEATGVGVNLQAASCVLFVEPPWSSAEAEQAEDRCHRLGQTESVSVTYLIAADSIDEPVWATIDRKASALRAVLDGQTHGANDGQQVLDAVQQWMTSTTAT